MNVDAAGTVTLGRLVKSVIRSRVKGVYGEVNALFGDKADETLRDKYADVLPEFAAMRELAGILRAAKTKRGALNFDSGDREIILDENGVACGVKREERGEAELMIEDFMLCANEAVAKYALSHKLPFVYRVHEEPGREKLEVLAAALRAAGVDAQKLRPGVTPLELADILGRAASSPKAKLLGDIALRSMAKARYSPDCLGHFGLALSEYCHFTSPIRRYPDLSIHRILSDSVAGVAQDEIVKRYTDFAVSSSAHSSECEVTAMQVEWDCDDIYAAEYMSRHIGERFDGTISSVKQFGMYVELENTVEGLVRIDKLPGWYEYDERAFALRCPQTGKCHTVGDAVKVIAEHADIPSGQIDFELI
jgi:ribonuclease R